MGSRNDKDRLYDAFASVTKALASGRRLELLDVLAQGERTVEVLAGEIAQSVANTSHHLRTLAAAGLVATRRDGVHVHYRLASDEVGRLWAAVRSVAEAHTAELAATASAYLGDRRGLEVVDRDELARRLAAGEVVVLDVRPAAEFAAGHLPGAVSVPPAELQRRLRDLPEGVDVVAYCRGPYCVYADDAVRLLRQQGRAAARLADGFPEWAAEGRPTETGAA